MMKLCVAVLLLVVIAPACRALVSVDERRYEIELDLDYFGDRTPSCSKYVLLSLEYLELSTDCVNEDFSFGDDCPESCQKAIALSSVECQAEFNTAWIRFLDETQESLERFSEFQSYQAEAYFRELDFWFGDYFDISNMFEYYTVDYNYFGDYSLVSYFGANDAFFAQLRDSVRNYDSACGISASIDPNTGTGSTTPAPANTNTGTGSTNPAPTNANTGTGSTNPAPANANTGTGSTTAPTNANTGTGSTNPAPANTNTGITTNNFPPVNSNGGAEGSAFHTVLPMDWKLVSLVAFAAFIQSMM